MWTKASQELLTSCVTVVVSDVLCCFKLALPSLLFLSWDEVNAAHSDFDRCLITQGHFTHAVNSVSGFVKYYYYACTLGSDFMFPVNMARSLRRGHLVDYMALNTLSTVDFEAHFKAKKYKSRSKFYLVERLNGRRRSKNEVWTVRTQKIPKYYSWSKQSECIFNNFRTLTTSWNGRIGLHGPVHENLQLIWVGNLSGTRLSLFSGSVRDNHPCTHLGSILGLGSTQSLCFLLINNFIGPYTLAPVSVERVQSVSTSFLQGILSILRSNAIKVNYSSELRVDHDIVRYVIWRKGKKHTMELEFSMKRTIFLA